MSATIVGGSSGVAFDVDAVPKAARAILYDSAGNPIESATVNSEAQLLAAASQYVYEFTANSSTANIGAGASFTGASQSNMGVAAIQVGIFVNQNCMVELQQSINGSDWDFVSRYFVVASVPDNRTFVAKGSFVRIVVTNTSGSTATTVRIQTIGVPVSAPLTYRDGVAVDWVQQPTYRAVFTGAPLAGVCMSLKGSASKLVTVTRVGWSATDNAGTSVDVTIAKCTAMAPGTAASLTMVPLDSKFPAATALASPGASRRLPPLSARSTARATSSGSSPRPREARSISPSETCPASSRCGCAAWASGSPSCSAPWAARPPPTFGWGGRRSRRERRRDSAPPLEHLSDRDL